MWRLIIQTIIASHEALMPFIHAPTTRTNTTAVVTQPSLSVSTWQNEASLLLCSVSESPTSSTTYAKCSHVKRHPRPMTSQMAFVPVTQLGGFVLCVCLNRLFSKCVVCHSRTPHISARTASIPVYIARCAALITDQYALWRKTERQTGPYWSLKL